MKQELNIAAILKDKPKNTKLWSPIFGECLLDKVDLEKNKTWVVYNRTFYSFDKEGKSYPTGNPVLFPSKGMRDWDKFTWKKGDVLLCGVDNFCIFNEWVSLDYTEFDAAYVEPSYTGAILSTKDWSKVTNNVIIKQYISKIEEIKGGKLNLETLEIEHPKQKKEHDFKSKNIQVSEYSKEHKFQPLDLCLMRNYPYRWELCLYAYQDDFGEGDSSYHTVNGRVFTKCIPYNNQTKHLLGTKDSWKGGDV